MQTHITPCPHSAFLLSALSLSPKPRDPPAALGAGVAGADGIRASWAQASFQSPPATQRKWYSNKWPNDECIEQCIDRKTLPNRHNWYDPIAVEHRLRIHTGTVKQYSILYISIADERLYEQCGTFRSWLYELAAHGFPFCSGTHRRQRPTTSINNCHRTSVA